MGSTILEQTSRRLQRRRLSKINASAPQDADEGDLRPRAHQSEDAAHDRFQKDEASR
jgi:hypothetical protein